MAAVLPTYVTYAVSRPTMDYLDRFADHGVPVITNARPTVVIITAPSPQVHDVRYGVRSLEAAAGYEEVTAVAMRGNYYQTIWVLPEWAATVRDHVNAAVAQAAPANDPGRYDETVGRRLDRFKAQLPGS